MKGPLDTIQQDEIVVKNHGSTTITYEWKKVQRGDHIASKKSDFLQRFFCHYPRNILKPGESKTFTFSFRSEKVVGMFNEEWELLTEPLLMNSLPMLSLSGISLEVDQYAEKRDTFWQSFETKFVNRDARETVLELVDRIKTPEQDTIDPRNDCEEFAKCFEEENMDMELRYTKSTMDGFYDLLEDIDLLKQRETGRSLWDDFGIWNTKVNVVEKLICEIQNPMTKQMMLERFIKLVSKARKTPNERAHSFGVIRTMVGRLADTLIDQETKVRDEIGAQPIESFRVPDEDETEEQRTELLKQSTQAKQESMKKLKKKPKTEEEEAKELEDINSKVIETMSSTLVNDETDQVEREIELVKTKWLMDNHKIMNDETFDCLNRKVSIMDIDFAEQEIILRVDLDIPLNPFIPMPPIEEEFRAFFEAQAEATMESGNKSKKKKKNKKQLEEEAEQYALLEQAKKLRSEPWKQRQILDHRLIKRTSTVLKHLQEHLAKRIVVLASIGEKQGRSVMENSMRILINPLQHSVADSSVQFLDHDVIGNIEKIDELKENVIYVMENLNFMPDEHSYVAPYYEPEEDNKKQDEEDKDDNDDVNSQKNLGKGAPPKDVKKMSAAEKKKADEEAKKKAEEDSKAAAAQAESAESRMERDRLDEVARMKDLAKQMRLEQEYFDTKTTYRYLSNLGKQMGTLYVNDAPLACLSTSNSVAEIKCDRKVMGLKMTEEVRKLSQFFLKKYPLDVKERHKKQPEYRDYYDMPFAAILGGSCNSVSDLMDKVLLANSLLDNASAIYLVGEIGIAAAFALNIEVSRVERFASSDAQRREFAECKPFFIRLFEKAAENNVNLQIPIDYVTAPALGEVSKSSNQQQFTLNQDSKLAGEVTDEKSGGSKLKAGKGSTMQVDAPAAQADEQQQDDQVKEQSGQREKAILAANPNMHWTDVMIQAEKSSVTDLKELITARLNKISAEYMVKSEVLSPDSSAQPFKQLNSIDSLMRVSATSPLPGAESAAAIAESNAVEENEDNEEAKEGENAAEESRVELKQMDPDDFILQYGPETMQELGHLLAHSYKVFWDGSISLYNDTIYSSTNNKEFLNKLLEIRMYSDLHQEPPVTLIHGHETEVTLRETLMRIKVEQAEELERMKQKQLEQEEVSEEEDDMDDLEESKEEISTFQEDMDTIADFLVADSTPFTTKLLQGVPIRSLYSFDTHRKQSQEEQKEALNLLEEI